MVLAICGLLALSTDLCGQVRADKLTLTKESDTTFWTIGYTPMIKRCELIDPNDSIDFFRISSPKYFLELSKKSNKMVLYVNEIWEDTQTDCYFSKSFELELKQVVEIKKLIDSLDILLIPNDKFIEGWSHGFDGITYFIENKMDSLYSFKSYWTPSAQTSLKEAKALSDFVDKRLDNIIDYQSKKKLFEREIPFYGWAYNGSTTVTKVTSDTKAFRKYKKEKERQIKTPPK